MRKSDFIYRYRVRNWQDYRRALVQRGSTTFWVDKATKEDIAVDLTTSGVRDNAHMPEVLERVSDEVRQVPGDRAYDTGRRYQPFSRVGRFQRSPSAQCVAQHGEGPACFQVGGRRRAVAYGG